MKPLILIVEDEPAIADNIIFALSTEGFDTLWEAEGGPVLHRIDSHPVDLVILDIGLPDMNGMELCKAIREKGNIPVIFLTARAQEIDRVVGLEIGADDYVVKPFSPRELTARVRAVLRRTRGSMETPAAPGSTREIFTVDPGRHKIVYRGRALDLSRYEYRLLAILIRRPGQIFSRDRLMEMAWDEPDMSMDRTVDAHIKNLRAKLRAVTPETDPIKTHRGLGYSLKESL
ncbi:MAG: two-component system response regulator CreB [Desulfobacter sp.]|nr:MAG: two-component system response regulator CreB [Desulfobacter sp.]